MTPEEMKGEHGNVSNSIGTVSWMVDVNFGRGIRIVTSFVSLNCKYSTGTDNTFLARNR